MDIIIFPIIIPIFFALLTIIFANNFFGKIFGLFSCILGSFFSWKITEFFNNKSFLENFSEGPESTFINYFVGGVDSLFGIALKANFINSNLCFLINLCASSIFLYLIGTRKNTIKFSESFLILVFICGMNGILLSNDLFNIFVFLEVSSIASYAIVVNSRNFKSPYIAFSYLIFGSIAASFYLIGIIFLYNQFGFFNIDLISKNFNNFSKFSINFAFGSFFILTGLLLKFGIFPVYKYLIQVYQKSSSHITAFFSGISSKINFYLIFLMFFSVLKLTEFEKLFHFGSFLGYFGLFNALFFGILANFVSKDNIKKILGYSSFSQMSLLFSFFLFGKDSFLDEKMRKIMMQLIFNHSFVSIGLFLFFESFFSQKFIELEIKNSSADSEKYLFKDWQKKILSFFFLILIFHGLGLPPLLGFLGKFSLSLEMFNKEKYFAFLIFFLIILSSILYNLKILFEYFEKKDQTLSEKHYDEAISKNSFKIINFYSLSSSLGFLIFCLFLSLFLF